MFNKISAIVDMAARCCTSQILSLSSGDGTSL